MSNPSTCLSDVQHDHGVSDPAIHYNGCLRTPKRARFYASLPTESQQQITRVNNKTSGLRHRLETSEHDSTAGACLSTFKDALTQWRAPTGRPHGFHTHNQSTHSRSWASTRSFGFAPPDDIVNDHIKAPVMYLQNGHPVDTPRISSTFPQQKVTMADLLSKDETRNPIMQPCEEGTIRYFHLPANNMIWVEEVLARYYHEDRPESDNFFLKAKSRRPKTKTELLLRPELWQGQQNFDADAEVHARHMRPFFSAISKDSDDGPGNLALFMPYLHWETDRGRAKSAEIVKQVGESKNSIAEVIEQAKQQQQNQHPQHHRFANTHTDETLVSPWPPQPATLTPGDSVSRKKALGNLLRSAAALLEAMDAHAEEMLMKKYLHAQPPLHPRRTLDQAYYGALRSTRARDRDQVVYRGTTPEPHDCVGMEVCPQCKEDVRKTPRLVMVDQLWMWILDGNTVITSFPRRWGRNRPDPTAIHKSLRSRLNFSRPGEISSAYDIALVIIDECSRVFFDRAKIHQRQPNLTELFTSAIRDLTYKQTAAFDQFLIYTHLASRDYKQQKYSSSDNSNQNHLLNINPEGELLKEAKDIIDELHIMMRIKEQQQHVMGLFAKHIRHQAAQNRTIARSDTLLLDHSSRISELQGLLQNAQLTSAALKDLLTLKQQQASVIEAREAVKQAQLTLKQGQSIMIFTIVTIIFLPLSFFVGLFGMNAIEINDGLLHLSKEFKLMFPISAGIILISFLFAFSRSVLTNSPVMLVRSIASFLWNTGVTWIMVKSGMYVAGREMAVRANRLRSKEAVITGAMKAEVLRKEKNMEKMRAAGHVKELVRTKTVNGNANTERIDEEGMRSPFGGSSMGFPSPGSPRPLIMRKGGAASSSEFPLDVEMGSMERKPSSQMYLVPSPGSGRH
ncbi:magnesium transport protein cora [Podospora australis]|uniref:Magnesium transport protein cora n=1 Tax=Podospora australis TaxID=1536484 RepID=A0AAN7AEE2_9PEZI|nr:magnesium transport protein cora [Podospora australis]